MTQPTNYRAVIEQLVGALTIGIAKHWDLATDASIGDAITAGREALAGAQQGDLSRRERFANAVFKMGRNAGLEEAKNVAKTTCHHEATEFADGYNMAALNIEAVIESLKDNTP